MQEDLRDSKPTFLDYQHADHASALGIKYVADLVEWLRWEVSRGNDASVALIRQRRNEEAYYAAAKAEALSEILLVLSSVEQPETSQEDDFRDPALPDGEVG